MLNLESSLSSGENFIKVISILVFNFLPRKSPGDEVGKCCAESDGHALRCFFLFESICDLTFIKLDQILNSDFTEQEMREFEQQWRVPVLRIANVTGRRLADGRGLDGRADITVGHQITLYQISYRKPNHGKDAA